MAIFRYVRIALVFACVGCGSGSGGDAPDSSNQDASSGVDAATPDGGGGGTISGSPGGSPFSSVATSYVIGAPDDQATTVVFVFSKPVACADLGNPGWDQRITDGTQILELKAFGTSPADFNVVTTLTPAPGEASVNYTLSSTTGTPNEIGASGGTLTLSTLSAGATATGSFALMFGADHLTGTFDAIYCPGGHEP
ncbi:MAG: hypothetical protein ACRELY_22325 [Polyangiaceae bacterium]